MTNKKKAVGDEVASLCTKCKRPQTHLISSMVQDRIGRVQCKICGGLHRYRNPDTPPKSPRKRPVRISPEEGWEKMIHHVAAQEKIPYTFSGHFKVHDLIDHATFGLGVVTHLLYGDKIQVVFKEGEKILVARR